MAERMNGAESLVRTLVGGGVEVCFANPGTSEMHFVAALDRVEGMRCVLGLFEGVVTGAADGYYRMADKPAATHALEAAIAALVGPLYRQFESEIEGSRLAADTPQALAQLRHVCGGKMRQLEEDYQRPESHRA